VLPVRTPRGEEGALVGTITVTILWERVRAVVEGAGWVLVVTAVVFVMFGAYLLRRRIVMPLRQISGASARIAEGRLATRLEIPGAHELADLGEHFNRMAESLEGQRKALVAAERSLARSERLASVGRLAAGVAHEVGNPVAAILGFSEVALRDQEISERTRDALTAVKAEALRIRSLIRELLDLARSGDAQLGEHDLGAALGPIVDRMRAQCDQQGVDVGYEQAGTLPPIRTDLRRMEQIVVNLIENALHAVQEIDHGKVQIRVHPVSHVGATATDPSPNGGEEGADPARPMSVALEVIDNGPGIPAENLPRVFDPFFTTKDPGVGTGLGLWNAHRWAERLGGHLEVSSSSGQTRFILFLPTADSGSWNERDASAHH
jgi:signal transduction histidine kinase